MDGPDLVSTTMMVIVIKMMIIITVITMITIIINSSSKGQKLCVWMGPDLVASATGGKGP